MPPEVSALDEDLDLKEIGLSQQVWDQLHFIGRQNEVPPLELTLSYNFGMHASQKWMRVSWIWYLVINSHEMFCYARFFYSNCISIYTSNISTFSY